MPQKDPEARRAWQKKYDAEHAETKRQKSREWYAAHKDDPEFKRAHTERTEAWRRANPEKVNEAKRRRREERAASDPVALKEEERRENQRARARQRERVLPILEEAAAAGCEVCGETEFLVLDFHHRDPATKSFEIGKAWQRISKAHLGDLRNELAKCAVLCANHHAALHAAGLTSRSYKHARGRLVARARERGCFACGLTEPLSMTFHHVDPATKLFDPSQYQAKGRSAILYPELLKCVVLCSNDHRRLHAGRIALPPVDLADYWMGFEDEPVLEVMSQFALRSTGVTRPRHSSAGSSQ